MKKVIKFCLSVFLLGFVLLPLLAYADIAIVDTTTEVKLELSDYILQLMILLFSSFAIESLLFYFFGLRRLRNYLWLLLANLVSYPTAVMVLNFLSKNFGDNRYIVILVAWFLIELLVFFIEYYVMWLGLRKQYTKKQIVWFVFLVNVITALIGLALTFYFNEYNFSFLVAIGLIILVLLYVFRCMKLKKD